MDNKKQVLVITIPVLLCWIPGCIFTPFNNQVVVENDLTSYDFDLYISTEKKVISMDDVSIDLKLILTNKDDIDIKIETYQIFFPYIELSHPNGFTYLLFHGNISVEPNYELIKQGGEITSIINLKGFSYWNGTSYSSPPIPLNLEVKGSYKTLASAYGIKSNEWEFEVISNK